jgi:hypothetical protein
MEAVYGPVVHMNVEVVLHVRRSMRKNVRWKRKNLVAGIVVGALTA